MENIVSITRPTWRAVREACERAEQMAGQTVEAYAEIGDMLIELQPKTAKGEWTTKCRESLYASDMACQVSNDAANQQASRYMRLARHRAAWQPHNPDSLSKALKLLPKKEAPQKSIKYSATAIAREEGLMTSSFSGGNWSSIKRAVAKIQPDKVVLKDPSREQELRKIYRTIYEARVASGRIVAPTADAESDADIPTLAGHKIDKAAIKYRRQLDLEYAAKNRELQASFEAVVVAEVERRLPNTARDDISRAESRAKKAEELKDIYRHRAALCKQAIEMFMDNWRTLSASLHPDRPDRTPDQLTKASDVLLRIKAAAEKIDYRNW